MVFVLVLFSFCGLRAKGNWEIGLHYSYWTLNVATSFFENNFTPDIEDYDPDKGRLNFDSSGSNYGIAVRFFPGGKNGGFSIGISYERNNFYLDFEGSYSDTNDDGDPYDATASGSMDLFPHSFNLTFRWELWPSKNIHPFIGIGLGAGLLEGDVQYQSQTVTYRPGGTDVDTTSETMTLKEALDELEDEGDGFPLGFFPIIHIHLGVRGEVISNVYLLGEIALYNGFIFRAGLAYRFDI
jgi:opacity protein-like surface antigen